MLQLSSNDYAKLRVGVSMKIATEGIRIAQDFSYGKWRPIALLLAFIAVAYLAVKLLPHDEATALYNYLRFFAPPLH